MVYKASPLSVNSEVTLNLILEYIRALLVCLLKELTLYLQNYLTTYYWVYDKSEV